MINDYVVKLIDNLPDDIKNVKKPQSIDLVLDGGIFNGSYLVGALYFLKEMEKRNYIKIERISGCSIGSIVAFLYYIDGLDLMPKLYEIINKDICKKINNKFFITYNNIKKGTKSIKSHYKNVDEIINTIIKSSYIPFLIDGNILYENKYIDGINPYVFKSEPNKKILYLDLFGYDKIGNLINVKNEKSNFHRILSGLLDIHSFFIKKSNTPMCSYVNDWNVTNYVFNYFKFLIEKLCIYLTYFLILIKNKISNDFKETILFKILSKITHDIFIIILDNYCL